MTQSDDTTGDGRANRDAYNKVLLLLKQCKPFLDSSGRTYCYINANNGSQGICQELRSQIVRDFICYRYCEENDQQLPKQRHITNAVSYINGQLWLNQSTSTKKPHLVTDLLVKMASSSDSGVGTASELFDKLVAQNGHSTAGLPANNSSFGRLLGTLIVECRQAGIDLYRPARRAKQRLWAWRRLTFSDANDTTMTDEASNEPSHKNESEQTLGFDDGSDSLTDEEKQLIVTYSNHSEGDQNDV